MAEYIKPNTLEETYTALGIVMTNDDEYEKFKKCSKDDLSDYHHGLGRWIRNIFGLWAKDPLYDEMVRLGFTHPDDMSSIIIESFHAKINNYDYSLEKEAEYYVEYWAKALADDEEKEADN